MSHGRYSFRTFVHRVTAVIAALALLAAVTLGVAYFKWGRGPSVKDHSVLVQPVAGNFAEYPVGGLTSGLFATAEPTLHSILENLQKAAADDRIEGVLLQVEMPAVGYAMLDEIRAGLADLRAAGKPVWAYTSMLDSKGLYLASACDSLFLLPTAYIQLGGLYGERLYLKGALDKLGIVPELDRIESYKSAAEMVLSDEMSPETREMMRWILGDMYPRITSETAAGFGVSEADLARTVERVLPSPRTLVDAGLAAGLREWDEVLDALPRPENKSEPRLLSADVYAGIEPDEVGIKGDRKVAVIHAEGLVGGKRSGKNPMLGPLIGYESVARDFEKAMDDDEVEAIVFRVNSGGGVSLTADRICRVVELADREKPVIVSMVDVAASGGYSVAYRARAIVAGANTITGSIGSITGKLNLRGFYNQLGITKDGIGVGPGQGWESNYRAWSPRDKEKVRSRHWAEYHAWVADIARHRDMTKAEVDSLARGRIWTGAQAMENGLVDEVGGLARAVALAKEEAEIDAGDEVTLVHYPRAEGFLAELLGIPLEAVAERAAANWMRTRWEEVGSFSRSELRFSAIPVP